MEIERISVSRSNGVYQLGLELFDWSFEKVSWNPELVTWFVEHNPELSHVLDVENQVRGFCLSMKSENFGYICWLAVHPTLQRNGVGSMLIEKSVSCLLEHGCNRVGAHVRFDGAANIFFQKCGFSVRDQTKIEMEKSIPY